MAEKKTSKKSTTKKKTATSKIRGTVDVNTDDIKSEARKTVNSVRESVMNVDFKEEAKTTRGFISSLFNDPLATLKTVATENRSSRFKNAVFIVIIWLIASLLVCMGSANWSWQAFFPNILLFIKTILAPVCGLIAMSAIVYMMGAQQKNKSMISILTLVTIAALPLVCADVLDLVRLFSTEVNKILNPVNYFAQVLTIVFMYFGLKDLLGIEDHSKFLKKFMIIESLYFLVYFVLSFLGIYMPII